MGHVSRINPPVLPHPAAALVSALGVMLNVMLVVTPVMATCTVELQVFAATELVLVVKVVLATLTTAPTTVGVAAGRFAAGSVVTSEGVPLLFVTTTALLTPEMHPVVFVELLYSMQFVAPSTFVEVPA